MSNTFSNTSTGDAPADPYKKANLDTETPIAQKIQDLDEFITSCKFGMMTTKGSETGNLVSRCMALAAKVCLYSADLSRPGREREGERERY